MLEQADQGRTLFLSIRWWPSLTTLEGALLDCHDWICRKDKSVTGESSLRKGQELRKHREIPRWRWGRGYAILILIKLTAFDRKKKDFSHLSELLSESLIKLCLQHSELSPPMSPILDSPAFPNSFWNEFQKLWDCVVRFHHRLTPGASGTNLRIGIWCHVSVTKYLQGQF